MVCPDCEGRGNHGHEARDHNGSYWVHGAACLRCNKTGRVVAPEGVLLAILKELRKQRKAER